MVSVRDILQRKGGEIFSIEIGRTVEEALALMKEKNIGALLVIEGRREVGLLSERDYARKSVGLKHRPGDTKVGAMMSEIRVEVEPSTTVHQCMRLMTDHRLRHLTVRDGKRLVGLISLGDVVNTLLTENESVIRHLEGYIAGLR